MQEDELVQGTKIENVEKAESVLINLLKVIDLGNNITIKDVEAAIKMAHNNTIQHLLDLYDEEITRDLHLVKRFVRKRWGNIIC
ncbi:hypothetical protein ACVQ92_01085 [Staphylococcus aureus]